MIYLFFRIKAYLFWIKKNLLLCCLLCPDLFLLYNMPFPETIIHLLIKLCALRKQWRWQIYCNYVDGKGRAVFNVILQDSTRCSEVGRISFYGDNLDVIHYHYAGFRTQMPVELTDLLLEMIHFELQKIKTS